MDYLEPLLPVVNSAEGMTPAELTKACDKALLRAAVLDEVLQGKRHEDDFNDLLRSEGWDPDAFWHDAEDSVDAFIQAGIVPDSLEFLDSGLVIPRHHSIGL
ncbi:MULTISPECIES: hypothetical protein [Cyanophyceae]|uniref:hypothetical protein n=1 Tax=Cyanophyceae TaxID=3028117 RepID=UPI0016890C69|nr:MULTISPECIES: hypothetical protein [Cyanophyceae]MBD1917445.1 hypothetical protein [Phormidium sp. FACHB-77]MBD2032310.1 hypothetical protein [Phormidium sp. FACHB-322]MBD2052248.1 hypothetical protein [Leptolyngbya sp. FACHB-60]